MNSDFQKISKGSILINSLCVFTRLKKDSVLKKYNTLLEYLCKDKLDLDESIKLYNDFAFELLKKSDGMSLKKYIIDEIFLDNNAFTNMIDKDDLNNKYIINQVKFELKALEFISNIESKDLKEVIIYKCKAMNFEEEVVKGLIDFEVDVANEYDTL